MGLGVCRLCGFVESKRDVRLIRLKSGQYVHGARCRDEAACMKRVVEDGKEWLVSRHNAL